MRNATIVILLLSAAPAHAQLLELKSERVVIFRDGYALFVKQASGVADAEGRVFTPEVPSGAILGTFWASVEKQRLVAMRAEWIEETDEKKTEAPVGSLIELLTANIGRQGVLTVLQVNRASTFEVSGKIADVIPSAHLVVVESEKGKQALQISDVRTFQAVDLKTRVVHTSVATTRKKRLSFELGKSAARQPVRLHIMYFTEGVRWLPTYRATGELITSATLSLQAELAGEAEDIRDAAIDLVIGDPTFRFKQNPSSLTLEQSLRQTLGQVTPNLTAQLISSAPVTETKLPLPAGVVASREQDLFIYHAGNFSLEKGARATLPLWETPAKVRHLYIVEADMGQSAGVKKPLADKSFVHQLELWNETAVPWAPGPALIMRGAIPLGQELLPHTPPGARALLPMGPSSGVTGTYRERELNREANAVRRGGAYMTLIRREGSVTLANRRSEAITVRLTAHAIGRADDLGKQAQISMMPNYDGVNPRSSITWDIVLAPEETKTLTYKTSVLYSQGAATVPAYRSVESDEELGE